MDRDPWSVCRICFRNLSPPRQVAELLGLGGLGLLDRFALPVFPLAAPVTFARKQPRNGVRLTPPCWKECGDLQRHSGGRGCESKHSLADGFPWSRRNLDRRLRSRTSAADSFPALAFPLAVISLRRSYGVTGNSRTGVAGAMKAALLTVLNEFDTLRFSASCGSPGPNRTALKKKNPISVTRKMNSFCWNNACK